VDHREYYWQLQGTEQSGSVIHHETKENLNSDGDYYSAEIYTYCHLDKWVYRTEKYTMILINTRVDGNKFLAIFDNSKEQDAN
jgi:hypothetical protein